MVLPLLMMMLVGIISAGAIYNKQLSLSHAAREGARYGATLPPEQTFASGDWASNVRSLVEQRAVGDLAPSATATICVALVKGSSATTYVGDNSASWYSTNSDGSPCDSSDTYVTSTNDDGLRVQVVVVRTERLEAAMFSKAVTLKSSVVMQNEYAS